MNNIDLILRRVAIVVAALTVGVCAVSAVLGYYKFALAVLITSPAGFAALFFLAVDVRRIMLEGRAGFFLFRFIFRLACFAILLYLVLVKFKLSAFGSVVGLSLAIFSMIVVLLTMSIRSNKS
jgi:hypothetical protein